MFLQNKIHWRDFDLAHIWLYCAACEVGLIEFTGLTAYSNNIANIHDVMLSIFLNDLLNSPIFSGIVLKNCCPKYSHSVNNNWHLSFLNIRSVIFESSVCSSRLISSKQWGHLIVARTSLYRFDKSLVGKNFAKIYSRNEKVLCKSL